jgi:hypothetical protein
LTLSGAHLRVGRELMRHGDLVQTRYRVGPQTESLRQPASAWGNSSDGARVVVKHNDEAREPKFTLVPYSDGRSTGLLFTKTF